MPTSAKTAVVAAKRPRPTKGTIKKTAAGASAEPASELARMLPGALASVARHAADLPEGDVASLAASAVDLHARRSGSAATSGRDSDQIGLCLVRPKSSSAAQALSSFRVELHEASRRSQLGRLEEFRSDTQAQLDDVKRWCEGLGGNRGWVPSGGLISAGMVMRLSSEEAARLNRDVGHVQVVQNRVLSLVSPTQRSLGSGAAPPPHAGWHLEAIGQRTARASGKAFSGLGVRVAVLDTGIQLDHPELGGRVTEGWRGWRQLPWRVDDNYLGGFCTGAGPVREAGSIVNRSSLNEGSRCARQEDHGPPSAEVQATPPEDQPSGRCRQGRHQRTQRTAHRTQ